MAVVDELPENANNQKNGEETKYSPTMSHMAIMRSKPGKPFIITR